MDTEYSIEVCKQLEKEFHTTKIHRPRYIKRYEVGTELTYQITGVSNPDKEKVRLQIVKFVGGGFAGQVYQVKLLEIKSETGAIEGLEIGKIYAMKILIPPSSFSKLFRNVLFWIGFQGPFQLQVNPIAARAGALWQKFIRRGTKIWFGDEKSVVDIHATFIDENLGSCGEISEWVEGRTWRLEVDDHLDILKIWRKGKKVDSKRLGSPEYRAKREFMVKFVELLHKMGGHEFARQYEWTTCKSQPNCLKRKDTEDSPSEGLMAVDFRAGLALLPFLPMSPGDFKLIFKGLGRGSLIQFDKGDLKKLENFIEINSDEFADMKEMLIELKEAEQIYRNSLPDITHNHFRLFYSSKLWSTIFSSAVTGWKTKNLINNNCEKKFRKSKILSFLFFVIGIIPFIGSFFRKIWGQTYWRKHYKGIVTSWNYFRRALRAKVIEKSINWHRAGRIDGERSIKLTNQIWRSYYHVPLSILPVGIHRLLTDWQYAKERIEYLALRPIRLYFNAELRAQWLRDMVTEGKNKHLLSDEDADEILSQVDEPFIQKYLKSLAVHLCTVPITQVISLIVAFIYIMTHPEMPRSQAYGIGLGIIALFQVVPISPGSLVRGLYVVYLVIRERNFKDYNIAVFLGFFKYIGYLAFPIQMAYRYPTLARFMAAHWATEAVHIVPVFGERGALLEHWVFCLFYNLPLTIRRRMKQRAEIRATLKSRFWHIGLITILGTGLFVANDWIYLNQFNTMPSLKNIWWLAGFLPLLCGVFITLGAKGAAISKRIIGAVICGISIGILYPISSWIIFDGSIGIGELAINCLWRIFVFTIFSVIGLLLTEIKLSESWKDF